MAGKVAKFAPDVNAKTLAIGTQVSTGNNLSVSFFEPSPRPGNSSPPHGVRPPSGARYFQDAASNRISAQDTWVSKWDRFVSFCREVFTSGYRLQTASSGLKDKTLPADEIIYFASRTEAEVPAEHWRSLRKPDVIWEFLDGEAQKRIDSKGLHLGGPCLFICGNLTCGRRLARHFVSRGDEAHLVTDVDEAFGVLKNRPDAWSLVILDLDSFGGILELSDDLMEFRAEAPEVPVLLLSSGFSQDDLSEERLPMCDASVRSPALSPSIAKGVKAAVENNKSWRLRCKNLIH